MNIIYEIAEKIEWHYYKKAVRHHDYANQVEKALIELEKNQAKNLIQGVEILYVKLIKYKYNDITLPELQCLRICLLEFAHREGVKTILDYPEAVEKRNKK